MTTRTAMVHRCDIQRDAGRLSEDKWGDQADPQWADHLTDVHCYYWYGQQQTVIDGSRTLEVAGMFLVLPHDTDLTADDRIEAVLDRRGRTVKSGPLRIDSLGSRSEHMIAKLTEVS